MQRVIRNKRTQRFLTEDGTWTERPAEALTFSSIPEALLACHTYRLHDAELVYRFGHDELDVAVPICH